ncbi:MAG: TfoX/Sxy family transcriptional regulator of competence genes [Bacteroidia bacterium]|jgi:TfoX/Sxy family transcriptional regulator of competence genes
MGVKGDKNSSIGEEAAALLYDRLQSIDNIPSKKMFSGYGVFQELVSIQI